MGFFCEAECALECYIIEKLNKFSHEETFSFLLTSFLSIMHSSNQQEKPSIDAS
jgi:hypothetical protein